MTRTDTHYLGNLRTNGRALRQFRAIADAAGAAYTLNQTMGGGMAIRCDAENYHAVRAARDEALGR
jgi:urease accessory protein UreH